jgi:hypothetical protein
VPPARHHRAAVRRGRQPPAVLPRLLDAAGPGRAAARLVQQVPGARGHRAGPDRRRPADGDRLLLRRRPRLALRRRPRHAPQVPHLEPVARLRPGRHPHRVRHHRRHPPAAELLPRHGRRQDLGRHPGRLPHQHRRRRHRPRPGRVRGPGLRGAQLRRRRRGPALRRGDRPLGERGHGDPDPYRGQARADHVAHPRAGTRTRHHHQGRRHTDHRRDRLHP